MIRPPHRRPPRDHKEAVRDIVTLDILRVGQQADGIAQHEGQTIYVPYTLAGEQVTACVTRGKSPQRAQLITIEKPSPHRVQAPCSHYTDCGGCALQHMQQAHYQEFKRALLLDAITHAGFTPAQDITLHSFPAAARRRTELKLSHSAEQVQIGYVGAGSNIFVPIEQCMILEPRLQQFVTQLPAILQPLSMRRRIHSVAVTLSDNGPDATFCMDTLPTPKETQSLADVAHKLGAARISCDDGKRTEQACQLLPVTVTIGTRKVALAPGMFLQASTEAQSLLTTLVLEHCRKSKRVADLFSGLGTYSIPLAEAGARVTAMEGDKAMTQALQKAAGGLSLTATTRDLFAFALSVQELAAYDTVVINPPRAGAQAQCTMLARSAVPTVVMVSCNPASFARDAAILREGGYKLVRSDAVDQFIYSPHLESVHCFHKAKPSRNA